MGATIIASPWSPPASMKTNNNLVGGELSEDAYDDYAAHLKSFVDFMANNGVPIYAVSVKMNLTLLLHMNRVIGVQHRC